MYQKKHDEESERQALLESIERLKAQSELSDRKIAILATPEGQAVWLDGFKTGLGDAPAESTRPTAFIERIWRAQFTTDNNLADGTKPEAK